jgi:restriction system protein
VLRLKRGRHDASYDSKRSDSGSEKPKDREPEEDLYETWKDVSPSRSKPLPVDKTRWSKDLLYALEWKRFEIVCAGYFEQLGFRAQVAREGADGGVDIHLYADGSSTPDMVVQCKAWKVYTVGVKPIRELLGVMTAAGVGEGIFVTTGSFTREARNFADGKNIHLIDGDGLLAKIAAISPEEQAALLQLATEGDFTTPTCASCGVKMTERVSTKSGEAFWGCVNFPRCRCTLRFAS